LTGPAKIACIVGARPNFIKIAPLMREFERRTDAFHPVLIHTGQHYDESLSSIFFGQLGIPEPAYNLEVGAGTPADQTSAIIQRFDALCTVESFDRVLVVGDVTSTMACAIVAAKRWIPLDHVEAGLRSFDRTMPEEINRIVTDSLATLLFVTEPSGVENLRREGHSDSDIYLVGNVMIDSLRLFLGQAQALDMPKRLHLTRGEYGVVTLHRPSNVDDPKRLHLLLHILHTVSAQLPLVFPVHPRTRGKLLQFAAEGNIEFCDALGYFEFLGLMEGAALVITDSGGMQEETTALGVPCLTLRSSTERPITVEIGTSTLLGDSLNCVLPMVTRILQGSYKTGQIPDLWDGRASPRIIDTLQRHV
jgi:UDP-N-acetylglucosamine 2-epimerase (non-hydrolysing)